MVPRPPRPLPSAAARGIVVVPLASVTELASQLLVPSGARTPLTVIASPVFRVFLVQPSARSEFGDAVAHRQLTVPAGPSTARLIQVVGLTQTTLETVPLSVTGL